MSFMYFAYGSNMCSAWLQRRCSSAKPIGVAELSGHELRWHKRSKDGSGKCDISRSERQRVLGVLYQIDEADKRDLDRAEGLGNGYAEIDVDLLVDGNHVSAKAYQATAKDEALQPYSWYKALVVAGAKENGLPESYVEQLISSASQEDPDRSRHERHMSLIKEVHK